MCVEALRHSHYGRLRDLHKEQHRGKPLFMLWCVLIGYKHQQPKISNRPTQQDSHEMGCLDKDVNSLLIYSYFNVHTMYK